MDWYGWICLVALPFLFHYWQKERDAIAHERLVERMDFEKRNRELWMYRNPPGYVVPRSSINFKERRGV
jgi:hypothetical protein